ncbi:type II secretion system protein N [Glaciimonas sp. GG7]
MGIDIRRLATRLPSLLSLVLFMLLCACATYWAMQFVRAAPRTMAAPPQTEQAEMNTSDAMSLFGAQNVAAVASNFQLTGVVVANNIGQSVAILSIDGKPAQAFTQGWQLQPGVTLQEVNRDYVLLSKGGVIERVKLAEVIIPVIGLSAH